MENKKVRLLLAKIVIATTMGALLVVGATGCSADYEEYSEEDWGDEEWDEEAWDDSDEWGDEEPSESDEYAEDEYEDYEDGEYNEYQSNPKYSKFGKLGSATEVAGTTVVVSIFADDSNTTWSNAGDELAAQVYDFLAIGCEWISENAKAYGTDATFIYDWQENEDLFYETKLECDIYGDSADDTAWVYIDSGIDSNALLTKYQADNIIYMVYVNTPMTSMQTSCTRNYVEGMEYPYEICYMYMGCDGEVETPAAFAHEMLHTFGAPDLYQADKEGNNYGTTQEMVSYYEDICSNDIMFTTYDSDTNKPYYDHISNELSEIDAYYIGLIDSSEEATKWGLKASQH